MALVSLVAMSGPKKVPIFRAHPVQWPSKWICPQQNPYVPRHKNNRYIIVIRKSWILLSLTLRSVIAWISSSRGLWTIGTSNASPILARNKRADSWHNLSQLTPIVKTWMSHAKRKIPVISEFFFILYNFELDHFFLCWICKEKYLQTCGSFKSQNTKKIGSANHNSAKRHICKRCANQTSI